MRCSLPGAGASPAAGSPPLAASLDTHLLREPELPPPDGPAADAASRRPLTRGGSRGSHRDGHAACVSSYQDHPALLVLGADGCKGGAWVIAVVDGEGELSWHAAADTAELLDLAAEHEADGIALDVPIGLPPLGGRRACDALARTRLTGRASSVFAAPPREVLTCATYAEARRLAPSLSAQAFGLVPRIREVDAALRDRGPAVHDVVVECHPEVAFAALAADRIRLAPKKTAAGALQRIALLEEAFAAPLPTDVPGLAALDDALDAAACALVALRHARGHAEVLGHETDALGLPMRIVV